MAYQIIEPGLCTTSVARGATPKLFVSA